MTTRNRDTREAAETRFESYEALVAAARLAHGNGDDLAPAAWARIRAGIEAEREARSRSWLRFGAPVAIAAAAALAAVVLVSREDAAPTTAAPLADVRPPAAPAPPETVAPAATVEASVTDAAPAPETPRPGDVLAAPADEPRAIDAFGLHTLTLAAGSRVRVVGWEPAALVVEVLEGSLRSEVAPRKPGEVYEVRTDRARVTVVGTAFTVTKLPDGPTRVGVEHGLVSVSEFNARYSEPELLEAGDDEVFGVPKAPDAVETDDSASRSRADRAEARKIRRMKAGMEKKAAVPPAAPAAAAVPVRPVEVIEREFHDAMEPPDDVDPFDLGRPPGGVPVTKDPTGRLKEIEIEVPPSSAPKPKPKP